jgi:hypothetical protein
MIASFIKLFLIGFVVLTLLNVAATMLPYVIVGYVAVYLYRRYNKREMSL